MDLVGQGGLLGDLTKRVLEAGLEAEMTDHLLRAHEAICRLDSGEAGR